jgi:transcription initiation factor TFIID subunit 15
MGDIPASSNMVSATFLSPQDGDVVKPLEKMIFSVKINNLQAGTFTNPDNTYYAAPQSLQGGKVVGHTHITVQDIGEIKNKNVPDAETFAFFKGINDAGDGQGTLSAELAKGLPEGVYRVCSMTSSSNHQPVLMPVAQRGAQDDCVRFTVSNAGNAGNAGGNNGGNNGQNGGQNNGQQGQQNGQQGQQGGQQAQQGQQGGQQGQQGQQGQGGAPFGQGQFGQGQGGAARGRGRFGRAKFAARHFVV